MEGVVRSLLRPTRAHMQRKWSSSCAAGSAGSCIGVNGTWQPLVVVVRAGSSQLRAALLTCIWCRRPAAAAALWRCPAAASAPEELRSQQHGVERSSAAAGAALRPRNAGRRRGGRRKRRKQRAVRAHLGSARRHGARREEIGEWQRRAAAGGRHGCCPLPPGPSMSAQGRPGLRPCAGFCRSGPNACFQKRGGSWSSTQMSLRSMGLAGGGRRLQWGAARQRQGHEAAGARVGRLGEARRGLVRCPEPCSPPQPLAS